MYHNGLYLSFKKLVSEVCIMTHLSKCNDDDNDDVGDENNYKHSFIQGNNFLDIVIIKLILLKIIHLTLNNHNAGFFNDIKQLIIDINKEYLIFSR